MHIKHPLFVLAFIKLALLGLVHHLATLKFWYWEYPWLDTGMHFLGGLIIGLFVTWFVLAHRTGVSHFMSFFLVIGVTLFIGVSWEYFELWVGFPRDLNFYFDTKLDILADLIGGIAANLIARKFFV